MHYFQGKVGQSLQKLPYNETESAGGELSNVTQPGTQAISRTSRTEHTEALGLTIQSLQGEKKSMFLGTKTLAPSKPWTQSRLFFPSQLLSKDTEAGSLGPSIRPSEKAFGYSALSIFFFKERGKKNYLKMHMEPQKAPDNPNSLEQKEQHARDDDSGS